VEALIINTGSIFHCLLCGLMCGRLVNYRSTAGIIYELQLAKRGLGVISSLCVTDIDFIIDYSCVS